MPITGELTSRLCTRASERHGQHVPAIRCALSPTITGHSRAVIDTARHILAWSQGRRWHQSVAQYDHYRRREALAEALAA